MTTSAALQVTARSPVGGGSCRGRGKHLRQRPDAARFVLPIHGRSAQRTVCVLARATHGPCGGGFTGKPGPDRELRAGIDATLALIYTSPCDELTKGDDSVRDFELAMKAVGDPTRTRILKLLEGGGLCVCQVQAVLGLAPSTVSKHLTILKIAGLVEDRRDGKWIQYALTDESRNPHARPVLDLLHRTLDRDPAVIADRKRLREVKAIPLTELCAIPTVRMAMPGRSTRQRRTRKDRAHA